MTRGNPDGRHRRCSGCSGLYGVAIAAAPEPMTAPQSALPVAPGMAGSAKTTPATPVVTAPLTPVGIAPAAQTAETAVTATCRNGTTFTGTSTRSACSGHKGVKYFAGSMAATDAKAESKQESKERVSSGCNLIQAANEI